MKINNEEIDINIEYYRKNVLNHIVNDIYLSNNQISILKMYDINYNDCKNMNELIIMIENILNIEENEDLECLSIELSDFNYYHNTNK